MRRTETNVSMSAGHKLRTVLLTILLLCFVTGAVAASGLYFLKGKVEGSLNLMQAIDKEEVKQMNNENLSEETTAKLRDNWTVAAFGLDSREGDSLSGANSDVIMLVSMNGKTGKIKLVSVYRDTCLKTGEGKYKKANSAYASGGPKRAVAMLNENLDLKIDDYIAFNWKAVADAINLLGGVELDITDKEFKYINSFITETVKSTGIPSGHLKNAGTNHLDGVQAVSYCRLRLMDDDFKRTERQQKVIGLLLEKASHADYATLNNLIEVVLPQTASSIDADDLYAVAGNIMRLKKPETAGFPSVKYCKTVGGTSYVFADSLEENVMALHEFLYGTYHYVPSEAVKSISLSVRQKAEGTPGRTKYTEETQALNPIMEETVETDNTMPAETGEEKPAEEMNLAEEGADFTMELISEETGGPDEVSHTVQPESESAEGYSGYVMEGPGYEEPTPEAIEDKEDGNDVYMD